jgi:GxxExxY protein
VSITDLIVNDIVMLELKAVRKLTRDHEAQLLNYLKATEIEVGLVLNFGPKAEFVQRFPNIKIIREISVYPCPKRKEKRR